MKTVALWSADETVRRAGDAWARADWTALRQLPAPVEAPAAERLARLQAAAALQQGDAAAARAQATPLPDRRALARTLLASAHQVLGRAACAAGREAAADEHLRHGQLPGTPRGEARRLALNRLDEARNALARRRDQVARDRKAGRQPHETRTLVWLQALVARCLSQPDVKSAADAVLTQELATPQDRHHFLLHLAEELLTRADRLTAVHYLNTARTTLPDMPQGAGAELAQRLAAAGQPALAMEVTMEDALRQAQDGARDPACVQLIRQAFETTCEAEQDRREHGHELLLHHLRLHLPRIRQRAGDRTLTLVEVGTTRENVPGQGSTRKIAEYCLREGIHFTTVDMDPHNSAMAQRMFDEMQAPFQAIAMKGEDYLRQRQEPVDFVFLDAYDFDHGQHSELRQSRYLQFLGSRIDEQACHEMHQDCAESVQRLLSPVGIVCIDDTWQDPQGRWTAKGTLAMPWLLGHGFELLEARNRAALLRRDAVAG